MTCPVCQAEVRQVASATPELAMFQHLLWMHGVVVKEGEREGSDADDFE